MAEGPVTQRRFSRRVVRQAVVAAGAVIGLLALSIGGWYFYRSSSQTANSERRQAANDEAQKLAGAIARPFADINKQLQALAKDADIVALFAQGDAGALAAAAEQRTASFPSALRLRLLLPGKYDIGDGLKPPLSFASLELLKRVEETDGPVSVEVHLFGTDDQHIVLIQAAHNSAGQIIGLLHLGLDVALIKATLDGLDIGQAYVELRQSAGARSVVLGSAGKKRTGEPVVVAVPDTRWSVAYWPAGGAGAFTAMEQSAGSGGGLLAGAGIVILAAGAAAAWLLRRRAQHRPVAAAGSVIYAGAVKAIMEGAHPGMEQLIPNLPKLGQKAPIKPVSAGMVGDDITMMISKADVAAAGGDFVDLSGGSAPAARPPPAPRKPRTAAARPAAARPAEAKPPAPAKQAPAPKAEAPTVQLDPGIFRAYDIRGVVGKTLSAGVFEVIGQAIGSEAAARGVKALALGRDGRVSSPELAEALSRGLRAAGRNVIDVGLVPTPLLYFATHHLDVGGGVMVTGSHNAPEYNGIKIVLAGESLSGDAVQDLYRRIMEDRLESGSGSESSSDIVADYVRRVCEDIPVALGGAYKLVVDCGNGVAGGVAPKLLQALGHDVVELYCEVDGRFPNHQPDPSQPENLETLRAWVIDSQADLGLAFDGDGDRLGVVDGDGNIIWPDRQLMLLARDVLSRNAGAPIIFDVKCSRHLGRLIEEAGGRPCMWRTGHSFIKTKMREMDAPLAGEMSGHIFFKERWYGFDDGIYTAARLLEVLMKGKKKPTETFAGLPQAVSTPELRVPMQEASHREFMAALKDKVTMDGATVSDIDGYRVEFTDGWGLVRPSNTSPVIVLRFEADNEDALKRIQGRFREAMLGVDPELKLPF